MCGINSIASAGSHYKQHGAALISAIFLITALAVLAALMTKLTVFGSSKSIKEWYGAQSLYAAESAVSAAAYDIISTNTCGTRSGTVTVDSNSSASYTFTCNQPGQSGRTIDLYEITATGNAGSGSYLAQRRIIVQFIP
jgi:MSHA biogenesis protein MshP